ncbi:MAG: PA14 domain-containing protein [Phototrophicaceae bacterium]
MPKRLIILVLFCVLSGSVWTTHAQSNTSTWSVEYFNNIYLISPAVQNQISSSPQFNWGSNSPLPGVNADNFSARLTSNATFTAGTYRFYLLVDDEARLSIDYQPVLDTFDKNVIGQLQTIDVVMTAGTHQIQIDYREAGGNAYVYLDWANTAQANPNVSFLSLTPTPLGTPSSNTTPVATPASGVVTVTQAVNVPSWTAQYYNNNSLSGFPSAILTETNINHNWGESAPVNGVNADNFSVRWTASPTLESGTYRVTVRADDATRVFFNNQLLIDRWSGGAGGQAVIEFTSLAGTQSLVVEYREDLVNAYLEWTLERVLQVSATPTPVTTTITGGGAVGVPVETGATATVTAYRLNVRAQPTTDGTVLVKLDRNAVHPIVGKNADSTWWQIRINGVDGWVYSDFVTANNTANVPTTSTVGTQNITVTATQYLLSTKTTVNLRSNPSSSSAILATLPTAVTAQIVARNATSTWYQVIYNGKVGWLYSGYVNVTAPADQIPIGG